MTNLEQIYRTYVEITEYQKIGNLGIIKDKID
jgi:hypothetical protein